MMHVFLPVDPSLAVCGCGRWIRQLDRQPLTSTERVKAVTELAETWHEHRLEVLQPRIDKGETDADQ